MSTEHVIAKEISGKAKLGGMSTTYTCLATCPRRCRFLKSKSCYGDSGRVAGVRKRLENSSKATPLEIAKEEAGEIDKLTGQLPLRIHTIGDCCTKQAAETVAQAAERYMARHGEKAYTYTHAWDVVPRSAWGTVSVLASCETTTEVRRAREKQYATSIVMSDFFELTEHCIAEDIKVIPCPKQAGSCDSCLSCGLCMQDSKLKEKNLTLAFKVHGPTVKAKAMLAGANK
jgi:hypothetical protein